jgi:hypothetical protein
MLISTCVAAVNNPCSSQVVENHTIKCSSSYWDLSEENSAHIASVHEILKYLGATASEFLRSLIFCLLDCNH